MRFELNSLSTELWTAKIFWTATTKLATLVPVTGNCGSSVTIEQQPHRHQRLLIIWSVKWTICRNFWSNLDVHFLEWNSQEHLCWILDLTNILLCKRTNTMALPVSLLNTDLIWTFYFDTTAHKPWKLYFWVFTCVYFSLLSFAKTCLVCPALGGRDYYQSAGHPSQNVYQC